MSAADQVPTAAQLGRTLWRCRRGMKELDLLLERFGRRGWPQAAPAERALFEELLELPDPLLAGYLLGGVPPADPQMAPLLEQIRAYVA